MLALQALSSLAIQLMVTRQSTPHLGNSAATIQNTIEHAFQAKGILAKTSIKKDCLKVMLEAAEVPAKEACLQYFHEKISGLDTGLIRQVKIYGRELGESFPDWQNEFEIVPKQVSNPEELAQQGNIDAITTLISRGLEGIAVTASLKNGSLRVMLEASEFPDQSMLVNHIFENVKSLEIHGCDQLRISGREPGDDFPDWQQEFELSKPDSYLSEVSEVNNAVGISTSLDTLQETILTASPEKEKPQSSQLELARSGDSEAITRVINYLLRSKNIIAAATLKGDCLLVTFQSEEIPDQTESIVYLRKILDEIKLTSVKQAKLFGRRKGSTFTAWSQDLELEQQHSNSFWGSVVGAVTGAAGAVGSVAVQAGGAVAGTVVGAAGAVGGAVGGATDSVGYALDMVTSSPLLQGLTKTLKVDWLLALIERVDVVEASTHVQNLQKKYPSEQPVDISHRIMLEKALYVGGSGFASSVLPGCAAAMFAVDVATTMAIQAEMVYQIAYAYGLNLQEPARKGEVLAIFGIALGGSSALKAGLGFARNIPVAGAAIAASSNAAMLYALGYAACRFYEAKLNPLTSSSDVASSQARTEEYLVETLDQQVIMDQILVHLVLAGNAEKTLEQILPDLQTLNLSPVSISTINANPQSLPPLEKLLSQLNNDFAVPLVAQCQRIAKADGIVTPQEAKTINLITEKFC